MLSIRDDIQRELTRLNERLQEKRMYVHLQMVGGSALIMNGITSIETEDIDVIVKIEHEIREMLDDLSIDINDDATDYVENYRERVFVTESEMQFSNISIEYLDLPDTLLTKMQYIDDEWKMNSLVNLLTEDLQVSLDQESIIALLDNYGHECDEQDINIISDFLSAYDDSCYW